MKTEPRFSPKVNKLLLVLNALLFVAGVAFGVISLSHKETVPAVAMLLVTASACFNVYGALKRLKILK